MNHRAKRSPNLDPNESVGVVRRELVVNGSKVQVQESSVTSLAEVLRNLGLKSLKEACGRGECGACTVLISGKPRMSCVTLLGQVAGEIETAEGLAVENTSLREAFADYGALQCGFCTPGQIVHATSILRSAGGQGLDEATVRQQMSGNICRCTGYVGIVDAIMAVGGAGRGKQ